MGKLTPTEIHALVTKIDLAIDASHQETDDLYIGLGQLRDMALASLSEPANEGLAGECEREASTARDQTFITAADLLQRAANALRRTSEPSSFREAQPVAWQIIGKQSNEVISTTSDAHEMKLAVEAGHLIRGLYVSPGQSSGYTSLQESPDFVKRESSEEGQNAPFDHSLQGERDTHLLGAFTPAKTMAPGYELEYWNLTMVRMKGDVVLTVRLPSKFSHYVGSGDKRLAVWCPGAVSSVRFTRDLWHSFAEQISKADTVFKAADELDSIL